MTSFLTQDAIKGGMYDPARRFAFKNIDTEEFVFSWAGKPIKVPSGKTIELPHHLAVLATNKLVDKMMLNEVKKEEDAYKLANPAVGAYYRSPKAANIGVPNARKVYEDKILRELQLDEESPEVQVMRAQLRDEIMKDLENGEKKPAPIDGSALAANLQNDIKSGEFADIKTKK